MFALVHRLTNRIIRRFDSLGDALGALQDAAVPELFYITNRI